MVQHSGSVVPLGLFANTAWRFILLCEILSRLPSPVSRVWFLFTPLISGLSRKVSVRVISQRTNRPARTRICIFCSRRAGGGGALYDRCQRQSFSRSANNISPVTIPSHIKCIELPALSRFPMLATSQSGWGMGVEGVVADERWQESGHSGWLSEDVMRARIPRWRIAAGGRGERRGWRLRQRGRKKLNCGEKGELWFQFSVGLFP